MAFHAKHYIGNISGTQSYTLSELLIKIQTNFHYLKRFIILDIYTYKDLNLCRNFKPTFLFFIEPFHLSKDFVGSVLEISDLKPPFIVDGKFLQSLVDFVGAKSVWNLP